MDKKLSTKNYVLLASLLFGLFFGAGNLIFPALMGQMAGEHTAAATLGFVITGVGLPLLGIIAISLSRSEGLYDLGCKVSRPYSLFFTCLLYLTIGPFFAIPRTATVPYTVGVVPALHKDSPVVLGIFSLCFFAVVLWFALRPSNILDNVGKYINPIFLVFLAVLLVMCFVNPMGSISSAKPTGEYVTHPFFRGFVEGYNTMDALASLAFGIIIINSVRNLGVKEPKNIAKSTAFAGVGCAVLMAVIYFALVFAGAQSRGIFKVQPDGGTLLNKIADHYMGGLGATFLAITITLACLKTAIGLVTACAETFGKMFPNKLSYKAWATLFTAVSFLFANFGLVKIIAYSIPVLMFLYPLTIAIILVSVIGGLFKYNPTVYRWTIGFTMIPAIFDGLKSLPEKTIASLHLEKALATVNEILPLSDIGMDWVVPSLIGFVLGLLIYLVKKVIAWYKKRKHN